MTGTQGGGFGWKRLLVGAAVGMLALMTVAGPASARAFGAVYANDAIYRVFGNAANVPDGTGTDPFAKFTNSTNAEQFGVAEFAPGSPTGHHGGRWAVYLASWTSGDPSTLVTSWSQLQALVSEWPTEFGSQRRGRLPLPRPRRSAADRLTAGQSRRLPDLFRGAAFNDVTP